MIVVICLIKQMGNYINGKIKDLAKSIGPNDGIDEIYQKISYF